MASSSNGIWKGSRFLIVASLAIAVTACGDSSADRAQEISEANRRVSADIDDLFARVESLESEVAELRKARAREKDDFDTPVSSPSKQPGTTFDQQTYEQRVESLCAKRGIDCS